MKPKFTEADLIAFGNYLLSDKRNNNIESKKAQHYVGDWDVSNVTDMSNMFGQAESFNQPISKWNTSKVTNMH